MVAIDFQYNQVAADRENEAWARFLARICDGLIVWMLLLGATYAAGLALIELRSPYWHQARGWLDHFWTRNAAFMGAAIIYDMALLPAFGTTPGKWLLGVRVLSSAGTRPGLPTVFLRSLLLWTLGFALRIGILSDIAGLIAFAWLLKKGSTLWDSGTHLHIETTRVSWWRWSIAIGIPSILALICVASGIPGT